MNPVIFDADAFLQARVVHTTQLPGGGAQNSHAMWWRRELPLFGITWHLCTLDAFSAAGPAVVDDYGTLVLAGVRS